MDTSSGGGLATGMEYQTASTARGAEKIKLFSGPGTRRSPRFKIADVPWITGASTGAGSRIEIANISRGGVLLGTREPLPPRTRIQLNLHVAEEIMQITGLVLRSSVRAPKSTPRYLAAVAFDTSLPILEHRQGTTGDSPLPSTIKSLPLDFFFREMREVFHKPVPCEYSEMTAAFLAASFYSAQDAALHGSALNDW